MQIKLNFQTDKPTVNGRIYPEALLKPALDNAMRNQGGLIITSECAGVEAPEPNKIVGNVKSYSIKREGLVVFVCDFSPRHRSLYQNLIATNMAYVTTNATGEINDKETLTEVKVLNLFITREATPEVMNAQIDIEPSGDPDMLKPKKPVVTPQTEGDKHE